jgi:hypothetical protein
MDRKLTVKDFKVYNYINDKMFSLNNTEAFNRVSQHYESYDFLDGTYFYTNKERTWVRFYIYLEDITGVNFIIRSNSGNIFDTNEIREKYKDEIAVYTMTHKVCKENNIVDTNTREINDTDIVILEQGEKYRMLLAIDEGYVAQVTKSKVRIKLIVELGDCDE